MEIADIFFNRDIQTKHHNNSPSHVVKNSRKMEKILLSEKVFNYLQVGGVNNLISPAHLNVLQHEVG